MSDQINILVMVCGSVAAIKTPILLDQLNRLSDLYKDRQIEVRLVTTEHAIHFYNFTEISGHYKVYKDSDEWTQWTQMGDEVLHIELRKWATIGLIAPIDANTLAKISVGICDNLLTSIVRAWDLNKPLIFCPAMNVHMWTHPTTDSSLKTLLSFGYKQVGPISKRLACGDIGMGAMAEVSTIVEYVQQMFYL
ncbi:phosphopantothenoylcysteine decarboxylase-like [Oppia nitens]|uniref:phosphopantothenoylcysteine decarboxylase-like n=1 Tax=Oppia nitens TaxID=1686743 RepID=UPI0023DBC3E3|nr:phosphopantothenoylcysteine decarboxylase-like [Oppia nitens]